MIGEHRKTRRQQFGMPDRWRLLEKLDPSVMAFVPDQISIGNEKPSTWRRLAFVRKSQIDELKEQYGDDLEVI